jgi:hypothetical protein
MCISRSARSLATSFYTPVSSVFTEHLKQPLSTNTKMLYLNHEITTEKMKPKSLVYSNNSTFFLRKELIFEIRMWASTCCLNSNSALLPIPSKDLKALTLI